MGIGNFVEAALKHFQTGQYDIALALASSAVDATASNCGYKGNNNEKYKKFLKDNMRIITTFGFPGIYASGIRIKCVNIKELRVDENNMTDIENIIYHTIRCGLLHQCDISSQIDFTEETYIGDFIDKFKIPQALVLGLIMSVVLAKCNQDERIKSDYFIAHPMTTVKFSLNKLWGSSFTADSFE